MPLYEYTCRDCGKIFDVALTLREHEESKVKCPGCQSPNVEQVPVGFYAVTSKKS